jgi:hypothetical protein
MHHKPEKKQLISSKIRAFFILAAVMAQPHALIEKVTDAYRYWQPNKTLTCLQKLQVP